MDQWVIGLTGHRIWMGHSLWHVIRHPPARGGVTPEEACISSVGLRLTNSEHSLLVVGKLQYSDPNSADILTEPIEPVKI
jgi:hypothetical protein